jgi:hypothetical protein
LGFYGEKRHKPYSGKFLSCERTKSMTMKPSFDGVCELIGVEAAVKISAACGGRRIYIPVSPSRDSALSRLIGHQSAQKMAFVYGGQRWDVPLTMGKKARIADMVRRGFSAPAIAEQLSCSERYVYRIRAELENGNGFSPKKNRRGKPAPKNQRRILTA